MTLSGYMHAGAVTLVIFLAALGVGRGFLHALHIREHPVTALWLAATSGLGLLSVGTLLLGVAGLLYPVVFALLLLPLAAYGLIVLFRSDWWSTGRGWLRWENQSPLFRICATLLLLASTSTVVWILLTHALMPPHEWDEIIYHLTLPRLFIEAHHISYIPHICLSLWPMNNEMLFAIALLFGSDIAPHLLMLGMTLLIAVGLLITARRHFDDRVGIVAVALFLSIPLVQRLAGTGLIDVAMGLYTLAALFAFSRWQQTHYQAWLVLCGVLAGFVAGSKLSGAAIPLLLGILVVIETLRRRPVRFSRLVLNGITFGLVCLTVVGPWYVRSYLAASNPVWPFAYHIFGGRDWDALGNEYLVNAQLELLSPNLPRMPAGLLQVFRYLILQPAALGGYPGGIGVVLPIGGLCATVLVRRGPRLLGSCLAISGGFFCLWFLLLPLQLRYLLPIVPLLALSTAYLVIWLSDRLRFPILQLVFTIAFLVLIYRSIPWFIQAERHLFITRLPMLSSQITRAEWIDMQHEGMDVFRYANTQLPDDARVLLLPYENRTYYLDRDYVWGGLTCQRIIPFEQFTSAVELATVLRGMNITHVIDNPVIEYDRLRYWPQDRALMLALRDTCGQILFTGEAGVVYALADCTTPSGMRFAPH